jgi:hypothetical protein
VALCVRGGACPDFVEVIMPTTDQLTKFILALDEGEHAELLSLLERELRETRVEARRTESPEYQDEVHHHETVLQGVLDKLRQS